MMRADQRVQVANDELLAGGKRVAQQVFDDAVHHLRMKHAPDEREQQQQEGEKRENCVRRHRERKSVHLGSEHIARR